MKGTPDGRTFAFSLAIGLNLARMRYKKPNNHFVKRIISAAPTDQTFAFSGCISMHCYD